MKITKTVCKDTAARADGQHRWVWDDEVKGFGLRVHPSKRISYVLKYRVKGQAQQRLLTLGWYPDTDVGAARDEARRIKTAAVLGQDPVTEKRQETAKIALDLPLTALLDGWREAQEVEVARKLKDGQSVLYERELLRLERSLLRPALEAHRALSFNPAALQGLLTLQTSPSTARNLRALIVRFVQYANAAMSVRGIAVQWPARFDLKRSRRPRREALFTLEEAARIWLAAGALGRRGALVRLMLLTGCRRIEAQKVQWDHIVFEDSVRGSHWQQPGKLTKNGHSHRVPLTPVAVNLLRWVPRVEGSLLVFPGYRRRGEGPGLIGSWTDIRRALLEAAGVPSGTLHDFRRTIVSTLGDRGVDPVVVDKLLNHAAGATLSGVMGVYQRADFWQQRVRAAQTWEDLLMVEVERVRKKPWAFEEPFHDSRIVRPTLAA